jgi:hypothetical protein
MFDVYCLLILGTPRNTHRIYLRLALHRIWAWKHIGLVYFSSLLSFFGLAGGYTYLVGAQHGAVSGIVHSKYSCRLRLSTGSGSHMFECFEGGGTGIVSGSGQGTSGG